MSPWGSGQEQGDNERCALQGLKGFSNTPRRLPTHSNSSLSKLRNCRAARWKTYVPQGIYATPRSNSVLFSLCGNDPPPFTRMRQKSMVGASFCGYTNLHWVVLPLLQLSQPQREISQPTCQRPQTRPGTLPPRRRYLNGVIVQNNQDVVALNTALEPSASSMVTL